MHIEELTRIQQRLAQVDQRFFTGSILTELLPGGECFILINLPLPVK